MSREVMQQALEALEAMQSYAAAERKGLRICDEAITNLRAALAEQDDDLTAAWMAGAAEERKRAEQAQPVAWLVKDEGLYWTEERAIRRAEQFVDPLEVLPLYTTPPAPQPLSGLDVERLLEDVIGSLPVARKLVRAVEAEVLKRMGVGK